MNRLKMLLRVTSVIALFKYVNCFYVPGVAPVEFKRGDPVEVKAVKMTSSMTQLPYEYYSLKFCKPINGTFYKTENLGEVLRGDRIVNTPFEVNMAEPKECRILCNKVSSPLSWNEQESKELSDRIFHEYYVHLLVDNLPCATKFDLQDTGERVYERGYKLGFIQDNNAYVNNHLNIILSYHTDNNEDFRVVRFEVEALSVDVSEIKGNDNDNSCSFPEKHKPQKVNPKEPTNILFTYSVEWRPSEVRWASRWDIYLQMTDVQIHWFSIVNSLVVVFFLSGILTMIMIRTLRRDIAR